MPAQPPTNPPPGPYGHRPQPPQHHGGGNQPPQQGGHQPPPPPQHGGGHQVPQQGGHQPPPPPQHGGGPQPSPFAPPPPPKKKNTGLIIGLVGGGLVILLGIVAVLGLGIFGFFAFKKEPTAEPPAPTSSPSSRPAPQDTGQPNEQPGSGADMKSDLGQLKAGDCVVDLGSGGPPETVPCSEPHIHQIFSVGRTPTQTDSYPGITALQREGKSYCQSARFELDSDRARADGLKVAYFTPNEAAWSNPNNRRIVCAIQRADSSTITEDYSKTA